VVRYRSRPPAVAGRRRFAALAAGKAIQ